jgi:hypothetical protein
MCNEGKGFQCFYWVQKSEQGVNQDLENLFLYPIFVRAFLKERPVRHSRQAKEIPVYSFEIIFLIDTSTNASSLTLF